MDIFTAEFNTAKHIPYAFRIRDGNALVEDYRSRRDQGTGLQILKHMRQEKAENVVTFIAHGYTDKAIDGKSKFSLTEQCVKDSLKDLHNVIIADQGGEDLDEEQDMSGTESERSTY